MATTEEMTITLPKELADIVRAKVASGEYASESAVILDSLQDFDAQNDLDDWLRKEVVPVLEAMDADPSRGLSVEQVRESLLDEHRHFQKAG